MILKSGVECEYFLINSRRHGSIADKRDTQPKPCYDQSALMRQYDLIKEICNSMINPWLGVLIKMIMKMLMDNLK